MIRRPEIKSTLESRRGITIMEVLVVITCVAMLLGICAVTLRLLMQLSTDGRARLSAVAALDRLSRQLRDDVHACRSARLVVDDKSPVKPTGLRVTIELDRSVSYDVGDGGIVRDELRSGKAVRHETYFLSRGRVARFEERTEGAHKLLALVVTDVAGKSRTDPPRPLEVLALPGKDRLGRLEKLGGKAQ
jgi:hypothetical protein